MHAGTQYMNRHDSMNYEALRQRERDDRLIDRYIYIIIYTDVLNACIIISWHPLEQTSAQTKTHSQIHLG